MTAITIDRSLLEQALDVLITRGAQPGYETERAWLKIVKSLEATLAAPATAPEFPADWAQMIHYPECWDTAAYPELRDAIHEALAWSGCSVCKPATAPDELEQHRKDAERYRWCVKNNLVLAGGTREFGWQIAPVGSEWNRYIDSAMKGTP